MYSKIKEKIRTTLRYRLFLLIFLPIITILLSLIAFSFYWTVNYTWQNALQDVSEKTQYVEIQHQNNAGEAKRVIAELLRFISF